MFLVCFMLDNVALLGFCGSGISLFSKSLIPHFVFHGFLEFL